MDRPHSCSRARAEQMLPAAEAAVAVWTAARRCCLPGAPDSNRDAQPGFRHPAHYNLPPCAGGIPDLSHGAGRRAAGGGAVGAAGAAAALRAPAAPRAGAGAGRGAAGWLQGTRAEGGCCSAAKPAPPLPALPCPPRRSPIPPHPTSTPPPPQYRELLSPSVERLHALRDALLEQMEAGLQGRVRPQGRGATG